MLTMNMPFIQYHSVISLAVYYQQLFHKPPFYTYFCSPFLRLASSKLASMYIYNQIVVNYYHFVVSVENACVNMDLFFFRQRISSHLYPVSPRLNRDRTINATFYKFSVNNVQFFVLCTAIDN